MKTLLYPEFERLEYTDAPEPEAQAGEVLLKVAAVGICGSELEAFRRRSPRRVPPLILGHEFCGTIAALGFGVTGFSVGERVISNAVIGCGACVRCANGRPHLCGSRELFGMTRAGAFAEYVTVPAKALLAWPENMPAAVAALAEPLANGVHMARLTAHLRPQTVLIIGPGPISLMAQQAFAAIHGSVVYTADLSAERRAVAERLGAKAVFDPRAVDTVAAIRDATNGEGVDLVIDAVGSGITKPQSLAAARPGGAAVWIGLHENEVTLNSYEVTLPERQIFGTYSASQNEMAEAIALLASGKIETESWVKSFPLWQGAAAFYRMLGGSGANIKAVLIP